MVVSNSKLVCERARSYYYDYLCGGGPKDISTEIFAHITQCHVCQTKLDQLKAVLTEAEDGTANSIGRTGSLTANMGLHFAYAGKLVTCKTVRPFLPSLADPTLEVGIPTPVTIHLDKCQQCTDDLEAIRKLNLTHSQLCRLGRLFAENPDDDTVSCAQVQPDVIAAGSAAFHETDPEVLRHLCICPNCRELLYKNRQTIHNLPDHKIRRESLCEGVSANDIFDCCFSYGIQSNNGQRAELHLAFTSHIRSCPECMARIQQLHRTVYDILEHPDSGIVTCFKVKNSARNSLTDNSRDLYADWPVEVEVLGESRPEPEIITFPQKLKRRLSSATLSKFRIPAVAAIILITFGLFLFNTPVASAVDLDRIYKAIGQIKNVYLATFAAGKAGPIQEIWVSRALNIKMIKTKSQCVLWDIEGKSRKMKDLNAGLITNAQLNNDMLTAVEATMDVPWGLLPFNNISQVPQDAQWQQVTDEAIENTIAGTNIYDLTWIEKSLRGSIIHRKWRGYIDTDTQLPQRIEQWEKHSGEEYKLKAVLNVSYPSTSEIQSVISNTGF